MKMNLFQEELLIEIKAQGVDFVYFVDISHLTGEQNRGFDIAVLIGIVLPRDYIKKVADNTDYVEQMIKNEEIQHDEFHLTEIKTDKIADHIAKYISEKGFKTFSQSEQNLFKSGEFDNNRKPTPLPHKTIARLAGLGWIGKHNLLITPEYGSAISMCSVLTNAPLNTTAHTPTDSKCVECTICKYICKVKAIKGETWHVGISRDEMVDVFLCNTCYQCVVQCPWTQKYLNEKDVLN